MLSRFGRGDWPYYLRAAQCLGADGALRKPFSAEELLAIVDSEMASRSGPRAPMAAME
jgi:DNA-binding response OmpR family regulator